MTFTNLLTLIERNTDEYVLIKEGIDNSEKDEIGRSKSSYTPVKQLKGIVQRRAELLEAPRGHEEDIRFKGYFIPNFYIKRNDLGKYRIKQSIKIPINEWEAATDDEDIYYKIVEINPNLFLRSNRSHYELILKEDLKFQEAKYNE